MQSVKPWRVGVSPWIPEPLGVVIRTGTTRVRKGGVRVRGSAFFFRVRVRDLRML